MKWYTKYLTIWMIVFTIHLIFFTSPDDPLGLRLTLALVIGTIITSVAYTGIKEGMKSTKPKKQKPKDNTKNT